MAGPWEKYQSAQNDQPSGPWAKYQQASTPAPQQPEQGMLSKALDYGLRGLDYAGGLTRTGLAEAIGAAKDGDFNKALHGQAPSTAKYMDQAGVPQGGSLSDVLPSMYSPTGDEWLKFKKGGILDPTARGTAGFVGDVLLDPLTYASGGLSAAEKAGMLGKAGKVAETVANPLSHATEAAGESIYKSGLKRIDQEAAKYGKEPVSDVLMKYGISGSAGSIQKQMDTLAEQLLKERTDILRQASKAGAEVSMKDAMAPVAAKIQEIRVSKNPELQPLADALESKMQDYLKLDAKPAEDILRELPVSSKFEPGHSKVNFEFKETPALPSAEYKPGHTPVELTKGSEELVNLPRQSSPQYKQILQSETGIAQTPSKFEKAGPTVADQYVPSPLNDSYVQQRVTIPGETVPEKYIQQKPATVFDRTEYIPGPDPLTATGYKSSLANAIPDSAWRNPQIYDNAKSAEKAMASGMRQAVEDSVAGTSGNDAAALLKSKNDELGRILTTKEKAALEAQKEMNKNAITSIDGAMLGHAIAEPVSGGLMLMAKKAADIAKMTGPRTTVGKNMWQLGKGPISGPLLDIMARREAIDANQPQQQPPPWMWMPGQ